MKYKDYYKILGLQHNATTREVKDAYHKLAHKYHPDVSKLANAEEIFKEVNEAYKVLKNPRKRALFDMIKEQRETNLQTWQDFETPEQSSYDIKMRERANQDFKASIIWIFGILVIIYLFTILFQPIGGLIIIILLFIYAIYLLWG